MKKCGVVGILISLSLFASCGKQETDAEKNAEIERQVQQRLAAERQAEEQQKLAQREAELSARESALVQKEQETTQSATPQMRAAEIQQRDTTKVEQRTEEPESYNTFYTKLEPYGAWREMSDYGYVWQPNEAQRSRKWRPYTNGRWVYTDAGWTWDSEEAFGWATYHYGRWTRLRNVGWVWIPGDEWAPAWVSWRKSDDYVGWAPLPPGARFDRRTGIQNWADNYYDIGPEQYCFVPTNDFGEQRLERNIVPIERNITIVDQTTNVTNITYNNTLIVNQGPNYDELRQRTRQPIQRLRLERRARFEKGNPRSVVRGEVIEMPAPAIAPARTADRPRAVKEKIAKPVVDHGWAGIRDKKGAEKARAKMKAEATPPAGAPPRAKMAEVPTPLTPVAPPESATPVRNFPERAKITPRPTASAIPSMTATPSPAKPAPRKEKAKPPQKLEKPDKTKAAKKQPAPTVSVPPPSATPVAKPAPTQKPSPAVKKPSPLPSIAASVSPAKPSTASPAKTVSPNEKKREKKNKKKKPGQESPTPSPTASR
jgi:hypothetical protein